MEPTPHEHDVAPAGAFELSAGALCLDFVNTWGDRSRPESDGLRSHADLVAFAAQAGVVDTREAAALRRLAARDSNAAAGALARARDLRDALYALFAAHAGGRPAARADLARVNAALAAALGELEVEPRDGGYRWAWAKPADPLAAPLRPIARSAAELLVGADLVRVRECHGTTCTWLFLDSSRNRSRRWCSMESCGNRAKARRHYRRQRTGDA